MAAFFALASEDVDTVFARNGRELPELPGVPSVVRALDGASGRWFIRLPKREGT